ncbi:MAG: hypothetical protein ACWGQW_11575, partial [bacterium]
DAKAVVKAYKDTSPPAEQLQVGNAIIEAAAYFLATDPSIRQTLAAIEYQSDSEVQQVTEEMGNNLETVMKEVVKVPGGVNSISNSSSLAEKVMRLFRAARDTSSAESKAKTLMRIREKKIRRTIARAQLYDEVARFYDDVLNSPEWRAYEDEVADLAGEKFVPEAWKHVGLPELNGLTRLPLPNNDAPNNFVDVSLANDLNNWEDERQKVQHALNEMTKWMAIEGNATTLEAKYMKMQMEHAQTLLTSSFVNDIQGNHQFGWNFINSFFNKFTQMWEGLARSAPVRAVQASRIAVRAWSDSMLMMNRWYQKWGNQIESRLFRAADSHYDLIGVRDRARAVYDWFNLVGREMLHLANEGYEFKVGDLLPDNQVEVTQEDIDVMKTMVKAADEAYEVDIVRGRDIIPERTVVDEFVPGVKVNRRTLKVFENMLPRTFNRNALAWTKEFIEKYAGVDARQNGFINMPGMVAHIQTNLDALISFLSDRDTSFTQGSPLEEDAYPALLEKLRTGEILTFEAFLNALDAYTTTDEQGDGEAINARQTFWQEFYNLQKGIYHKALNESAREREAAKKGRWTAFENENSFTIGRGNRIAPYWWYNHGFHSTAQIMGFMLNGSSFYLNWVKRSVAGAADTLRALQAEYSNRITAMTGKLTVAGAGAKARSAVERMNREAMRRNEEHIKLEDISSTIKALDDFWKELDMTFTASGKLIED